MNLDRVTAGIDIPKVFNVIIEIPIQGEPVKYEVDKSTGAMFVDRFLKTSMYYPCNYGYIPKTLSDDGDPVDVLVITPVRLISGAVIQCRAVGMLKMTDEAGIDVKVLAVPIDKLCTLYSHVQKPTDLPAEVLAQISHFFEHYKDLEKNKWVKIDGWTNKEEAELEIMSSHRRYQEAPVKPYF